MTSHPSVVLALTVAGAVSAPACAPPAQGGPLPSNYVDGGAVRDGGPRDLGEVVYPDEDMGMGGDMSGGNGGGGGAALTDGGLSVQTAPLGLRTGCDDDDDPLSSTGWAGFCADRRDDNCAMDAPDDACPEPGFGGPTPCNTADEPCPATLPASAPPAWDCTGTAPENVVASAHFTDQNDAVTSFCAYVYESTAVPGEFYVAIDVDNGTDPYGPEQKCSSDFGARRHLYFSNLDDGACAGLRFTYPDEVDDQILSNVCRKMIRNVVRDDPDFAPDIQYFASSRAEVDAKLAVLDTAEIACVGIDNTDGVPYRATEVWVVQAEAPLAATGN